MDNVLDLAIIGAGPGGVTAAIYAKRAGLNFKIFEKSCVGGNVVNAFEIENYPGVGKIVGSDLAMNFMNELMDFDIEVEYEEITNVSKNGDIFEVKGEYSSYFAKKVLVAVGTKARNLNVANEEKFYGHGVSFCATCDGAFYKNKDVLVVGGGNSALTEAMYLANIVNKVYLITRHELKGDKKEIDKIKKFNNVEIIEFKQIKELIGDKSIQEVILKDTNSEEVSTLKVDGIFVYVGQVPPTSFVKELNVLNSRGFIEVDKRFETSVKGLFAIGDCIDKECRQIASAVGDAATALHFIEY